MTRRRFSPALLVAAALLLPGAGHSAERTGVIAFLRHATHGSNAWVGNPSLYTVRADGSGLRRLTPAGVGVSTYQWSPDATRIAYVDVHSSLWVMRADGTDPRRLVAGSGHPAFALSWSPDGRSIAFVAATELPYRMPRIFVVPSSGGAPRQLPSGDAGDLAWSPRGNEIAYTHDGQIWTIRPGGTRGHSLYIDLRYGYRRGFGEPHWSSDGARLAFGGGRYSMVYAAAADGSSLRRLTTRAYVEYGVALSPDGSEIAYGREKREGIYLVDFDGRDDHRLTRDSPRPVDWGALSWSPDGSALAYTTNRTGDGDVYVIGADGRGRTRLTSSPDNDVAPEWAPR